MPASTAGIKISAKADEQWSASQKCNLTKIDGRPTKDSADRPKIWLVATKHSRWPQAMAGDVWGWPTSHSLPLQGKTQVFGAKPDTKQSSPEARRVAETSGNSR